MFKMIIRMNDDKITLEKKYNLEGIYKTIDNTFLNMGFPRIMNNSNYLVYCDNGNARDYGRFGRIVNFFKKQPWFMENVSVWLLCDNEDTDHPDQFNQEDLLLHYRKKQAMGI